MTRTVVSGTPDAHSPVKRTRRSARGTGWNLGTVPCTTTAALRCTAYICKEIGSLFNATIYMLPRSQV